jgi:hypothetical protein
MSPLFNNLYRLRNFPGDQSHNRAAGWDERRKFRGQDQRKRIHRPNRVVIVVVGVYELKARAFSLRLMDRVEMRVNNSGMIVVRSCATGVNMLKRGDEECQQQREGCRYGRVPHQL